MSIDQDQTTEAKDVQTQPTVVDSELPWKHGIHKTLFILIAVRSLFPVVEFICRKIGLLQGELTKGTLSLLSPPLLLLSIGFVWWSADRSAKISFRQAIRLKLELTEIWQTVGFGSLLVLIYASLKLLYTTVTTIEESYPIDWLEYVKFASVAFLAAPILEEIFYRGLVYNALRQAYQRQPMNMDKTMADYWAMVLSSLLFAAGHGQALMIPTFLIGLGLVWAYRLSGSLYISWLLHATNNVLVVGNKLSAGLF